jgi:Putative adhesin
MMRMSFLASTALAALVANTAAHASDTDQQISADPRGIVEVSNFAGKVEVSGWDKPQVSVHSDVSGDTNNVDVHADHGRTTIAVRMHGMSWGGGGEARLQIKIPRNSELDVTSVSADVVTTGVLGVQRLKTVSGSIKADVAQADVDAKTVSGDVTLHGDGKPADLHLSTISGGIRLDHGAGDLEAITVSGDLNLQLDPAHSVRVRTTSGAMSIQGKLAKDADFDAQTVSGDVKLHAGSVGGYDYEVSTFSGGIHNCFNQEVEKTSRYGPGERLNGTRGSGSGHVRVKTMSGKIELCDKS